MDKIVSLLFGLSLAASLGGCGRPSPVANNAVALPDNAVGDAPASGLAAPANAAAAEAVAKASMPLPTDGMAWRWDAAEGAAEYGAGPQAPAFEIVCHEGKLLFHRIDAAPLGGKGTMSFTGNGRAASVPAVAIGDTATMSSSWLATQPPSDTTQAVARVFTGPGAVEIALTGTTKLSTAPSPIPLRAFERCPKCQGRPFAGPPSSVTNCFVKLKRRWDRSSHQNPKLNPTWPEVSLPCFLPKVPDTPASIDTALTIDALSPAVARA